MARRKYKGNTARFLITILFSAAFASILYWINSFTHTLIPNEPFFLSLFLSLFYDIVTITIAVGSALWLTNSIVKLPKSLNQPAAIYVGTALFTFIGLLFWYVLVFAIPAIFTTIYADVAFSVIIALAFVNIDSN